MAINISSPNTPSLRELANHDFLNEIALAVGPEQVKKVWVKLDPDQSKADLQKLVESIMALEFGGIILTNTHRVEKPQRGGLSGHPLLSRSNQFLEWAYEVHKSALPMIGVGGVFSGLDVFEKLARGACAVQIYSSFVYRGPFVVYQILRELHWEMQLRGISSVKDCVGYYHK